jgi:hypothetical protein
MRLEEKCHPEEHFLRRRILLKPLILLRLRLCAPSARTEKFLIFRDAFKDAAQNKITNEMFYYHRNKLYQKIYL